MNSTTTEDAVIAGALDTCKKSAAVCAVYAIGNTIVYDKFAHENAVAEYRKLSAEQESQKNRFSEQTQTRQQSERPQLQNTQSQGAMSLDVAKKKCAELGFKNPSEGFGKCVLQLSK